MEQIEWTSSYSVGNKLLDIQHKRIIGIINQMITKNDFTVRSETVSDLLTKLTFYALDHFKEEERILQQFNYPDFDRHKEEHKAYRLKIASLCEDTVNHKDTVPEELFAYVREWWATHILVTDMKFRYFLSELDDD